ncbi:MAG: PAS domain-containing protein [Melioribacteraceae bacterium]|nr:PAS domain-containing protein [Melioribacteraceae bacterium]
MNRFQNFSIKNKLISLIIVVVIISTLISSTIYLLNDLNSRKDSLLRMAEMETELIGYNCSVGLEFRVEKEVKKTLESLHVLDYIYSAYVYDAEGNLFTDYYRTTPTEEEVNNVASNLSIKDSIFFDESYQFLNVIKPITDKQEFYGVIYLKITTEIIYSEIIQSIYKFIILLLSIIIISYLIAVKTQKYISSPIISLANSISEITKTEDYSKRVKKTSSDEVGQLYDVYNEMLVNLDQRQTEKNRAVKALKESEERFDLAVKGSSDGLWDWPDLNSSELWWSDRTYELLGYSKVQLESTFNNLQSLLHPDHFSKLELDLKNHFEKKIPFDVEYKIRFNSKGYKWFRMRGQALWNENDKPIRMSGTLQDINLRKSAEILVTESQKRFENLFNSAGIALVEHDFSKLIEELNKLRNKDITDYYSYLISNPDVIVKLRKTIDIINLNQAAINLFECETKELIKVNNPAFHTAESLDYIIKMFAALLNDEKTIEIEGVISNLKGKRLNVLVTLLNPKSGRDYSSVLLSYVDITEIKEFTKEREILLDEITAKNTELEQIIYVTSHDLRSPLVNIQGFSKEINLSINEIKEIISEKNITFDNEIKTIISDDIPGSLNFIINSTQKMDLLLNGLLRLSRLGRAALSPKILNLNDIMDLALKSHQFQINKKGIKIELEKLDECYGDEIQITQVFSNVIDNAIKYSDDKRQNILSISSKTNNKNTTYTIKDRGIGISKEHQKKVFEVFHRLNPSSKVAGEGIGLSIVKRILLRHDGNVWLDSELGKGTTFYIRLPKNEQSRRSKLL